MNVEVIKRVGITVGKAALRFMKIGAVQTAAFNLNEVGKKDMRGVSKDIGEGYASHVAPKLKDFKIIKGDK